MLQAIWVLARARTQIWRNTFWRGRLVSKLGLLALAALINLAALGLYNFTRFVIGGLRDPQFVEMLRQAAAENPDLPADPMPVLTALPGLALLAALTLLIFSSFGSLLASLYLSGDLDMLLVAPIPMRAVFVVKFFGGLLPQYLLLFALLGPVLLGYGQGMGYGPGYHLCAVLVVALLPLLPAGLGALLVMAVVRVLPAHRAREIVSVLGGVIAVAFYVLSQFVDVWIPQVSTPDTLAALLRAELPVLPSTWAGRALVAVGEGRPAPAIFYGGLFATLSVAVFTACLVVAERLYYTGWSNLAIQRGRPRRRRGAGKGEGRLARVPRLRVVVPLPPEARAILAKDVRLFFRDLSNLQALIFPIAFALIWFYQLLADRPDPRASADGPAWLGETGGIGMLAIVFFICLSLSSALAGAGISREGRAFWMLKIAPISPLNILLGKFLLAYLPFPTAGSFFLIVFAIAQGSDLLTLARQWALLIVAGLGCAAFGIGVGAAFPRLNWENPKQQRTWESGCLGALFYPLYLAVVVGLVIGAAALGTRLTGAAGLGVRLAGWTGAVLVTGVVVWLSALIGVRGLERIEV
ncbi:MAG: hypothetical protein RMK84_16625 [Oscillochloridaceae bacterium]|nr:hypothetical protein [Chloroflexaceae bacterium]MDW8391752.1 hypothetical protein [Oscillochloridaceae bacterium]